MRLILFLCLIVSCNNASRIKEKDYSNYSYEYYKRQINNSRTDEKVTVFINGRVSTMKRVEELASEGKIKNIEVIKDSNKIKALNYPYPKVKVLMFATTKK